MDILVSVQVECFVFSNSIHLNKGIV